MISEKTWVIECFYFNLWLRDFPFMWFLQSLFEIQSSRTISINSLVRFDLISIEMDYILVMIWPLTHPTLMKDGERVITCFDPRLLLNHFLVPSSLLLLLFEVQRIHFSITSFYHDSSAVVFNSKWNPQFIQSILDRDFLTPRLILRKRLSLYTRFHLSGHFSLSTHPGG